MSSYSPAPTVMAGRNWTAQLSESGIVHDMVFLNGKMIACGGNLLANCLQFDNPTGSLSAAYSFPWDLNNAMAVVNNDLILAGQWSGEQQYVIARFNINKQDIKWGFSIASNHAKFQALVFDQSLQQIIAVGNNEDKNVVIAAINPESGQSIWGKSYTLSGPQSYLNSVALLTKFSGYCISGYFIDPKANYLTSMLMIMINSYGALSSIYNFKNMNSYSTVGRDVASDPVSGDIFMVGSTIPFQTRSTNPLIARITYNPYMSSTVSWAIQCLHYDEGQFSKVLVDNDVVVAVGNSAGFFPAMNTQNMIILQIDASNGRVLQGARIEGPNHVICESIVHVDHQFRLGCYVNEQALIFSLSDDTLTPGELPPGYAWYDDVVDIFRPVSTSFSISRVGLSQTTPTKQLPNSFFEPLINPAVSSTMYSQLWPGNLPSARPTRVPTLFPTVSPSVQPSSSPSFVLTESPTSTPSISCHPTTHPSSSVPTITRNPMSSPTINPTERPSDSPTFKPSIHPSYLLSVYPSPLQSSIPTVNPSRLPSTRPSPSPSAFPTLVASQEPWTAPTSSPSSVAFFQSSGKKAFGETNMILLIAFGSFGGVILLYAGSKWILKSRMTTVCCKKTTPIISIDLERGDEPSSTLPLPCVESLKEGDRDVYSIASSYESDIESPTPSMCDLASSDSDIESPSSLSHSSFVVDSDSDLESNTDSSSSSYKKP